jgi:RNA polymerase sigma factor (TIGR02999 family)
MTNPDSSPPAAADPNISGEVTALLLAGREGDLDAYARVYSLVYDHLREVARAQRRRDVRARAGQHTLSTTAVVHEAWFRLANPARLSVRDRAHFLAIAARAMRQVLVQHARRFRAGKRGGGAAHLDVNELDAIGQDLAAAEQSEILLSLDDALGRLGSFSPRLAQVVECRWFGGLTEEETAAALGVTDRTVRRDWVKARAWLHAELAAGATRPAP